MNTVVVIGSIFAVIGALALLPTCVLFLYAVLARVESPRLASTPSTQFVFVVPSHNEEAGIAHTVASLSSVDYPREKFSVLVVADNCNDETASRARVAGAEVLERTDHDRRGKGYALELAFAHLLKKPEVNAVVVVDADTLVSANILRAFAARIDEGELAMQADYGVSNPRASWRTELMVVALSIFHGVRSLARERFKLSAGLRGNGMGFTRELLERFPHKAYGLVEDVEYGIELGLGGVRVAYVHEASVKGEMVSKGDAAKSQRRRWEGGRQALIKARLPTLLREGLKRKNALLLDLALDLWIPPLSSMVVAVGGGLVLAVVAAALGLSTWGGVSPWLVATCFVTIYVLRGAFLSELGARALVVLAFSPAYVVWKMLFARSKKTDDAWVRTQREAEGKQTP